MSQDIDPREPVDRYTDEDLSEFHRWRIDELGSHKHYSNVQGDPLGPIMETLQNAFDSCDHNVPNNISILLDRSCDKNRPFITIIDEGRHGICKDYHGEIMEFLAAKKATTEKIARNLQRKGIGMFQYPNLGSPVIITSMDDDFIHKIPVTRDAEGWNGFGKTTTKPNNEKYRKEFRIYNNGTRVAFFNKHPQVDDLSVITLRKAISENFALRLFDNQKVHVYLDDKEIPIPSWIIEHSPQVMGLSKDGNSNHDIRGHIWEDPQGNGRINVYQDGYLVEALQIDARKCKGYVEYNVPLTDIGRATFVPSPELTELKNFLRKEMLRFDKVAVPAIDKKEREAAIDLGLAVLGKYLNNTTYPGGQPNEQSKLFSTTTDPHGKGVVGYTVNPEAVTQGPRGPNVNPTPPNPNNPTQVGEGLGQEHGGKMIRVQSKEVKENRRTTRPLDYIEQAMGIDRPLWILQRASGTKGVPLLIVNTQNAEYPMYKGLPGGQTKLLLMSMWMSEISMNESSLTKNGLPDFYRMKHSKFRVEAWSSYDLFPKPPSDKSLANPRGRRYL